MERGLDIMSMDNGRRKGQMKIVVTNTTAGMIIGKGITDSFMNFKMCAKKTITCV